MTYFDRKCEPADDIVVLRILDEDVLSSASKEKKNGFVIGDESLRNLRIGFAKIERIGKTAKEKTNLDIGSFVYYDKLAIFYKTAPIGLLRYNAIILETNEDRTKYRALGGKCLVQAIDDDKNDDASPKFIIQNGDNELRIGVIKAITPPYDEKENNVSEFKVGDKILLTKEERDTLHGFRGDNTFDSTKPIYIYNTNAIICKLED